MKNQKLRKLNSVHVEDYNKQLEDYIKENKN
jgi:hypothetical protein